MSLRHAHPVWFASPQNQTQVHSLGALPSTVREVTGYAPPPPYSYYLIFRRLSVLVLSPSCCLRILSPPPSYFGFVVMQLQKRMHLLTIACNRGQGYIQRYSYVHVSYLCGFTYGSIASFKRLVGSSCEIGATARMSKRYTVAFSCKRMPTTTVVKPSGTYRRQDRMRRPVTRRHRTLIPSSPPETRRLSGGP